jgi:hypothetical protein
VFLSAAWHGWTADVGSNLDEARLAAQSTGAAVLEVWNQGSEDGLQMGFGWFVGSAP